MMPFFLVQNKKSNPYCPYKKTAKINTTAPLQVRKCCRLFHGKRALSWNSCQMQGSLSVEAALSLSLFLFFCFCLIMPMKMLDRQRQIQAVMESVGEELSQYAYVEYCLLSGDEDQVDTERTDGEEVTALLASGYAAMKILGQIDRNWVESVSFDGTDIGTDDMVHIMMKYRMKLPFSVLGLDSVPVQHVCSRRMWNGADGGRNKDGGMSGGQEDETVYIGKNSTRFHRRRTCHYLYNDLKAVAAGEVDSLRNQSGARYAPCKTCKTGSEGGMVYVMPYGTSYHLSKTCASIIAYVQAVPLSQAEHLGACSYCGGE